MLIASHRHTDADLVMWRELEAADRLHGRSRSLAVKVDRAMNGIREFLASGPAYCSVSWGKDSVVVADLCMRIDQSIPIVYARAIPTANPDCMEVAMAWSAMWPTSITHDIPVDYRPHRGLPDDEKLRWGNAAFSAAFRPFGMRRIMGLRCDESGRRKMSMRFLGLSTINSCRPIGWWSNADVFGYLSSRDLPIHPNYAMLGGGRWQRHHLRVDEFMGQTGDEYGRALWEREYYGDVLARIESNP